MVSSVIQFLQRVRVTATSAAALTSDIQAGIYKYVQKDVGFGNMGVGYPLGFLLIIGAEDM